MNPQVLRARRLAGRVKRGTARRTKVIAGSLPAVHLPDRRTDDIANSVLSAKRRELAAKRSFGPGDLEQLAGLLTMADEVVPIREAFARRDDWPERFVALRHDMDHDVENAVRMAEWEAEHGFRSTYYVLHGDWYWGGPSRTEPSAFVLRALDRIASLGHEIGLHNNAITLALATGEDPHRILDRDLSALRRHGFEIDGSVAHGDPLCRKIGYVNNEIFDECPRPELGGPDRVIAFDDPATKTHYRLELHPRPMADFGLTHEANTIGTAYLRLDVLPPATQPALRESFRRYVDARLAIYRAIPDIAAVHEATRRADALQDEIWRQAVSACQASQGWRPDQVVLPAINEMIDITTTRAMALQTHPPAIIYFMLFGLALVSSVLAGYAMAGGARARRMHAAAFALVLTATVYVILDLEFPRGGLIRIDSADQLLVDARAKMR